MFSPVAPRFSWMRGLIIPSCLDNALQMFCPLRPDEGGAGLVIVLDKVQKLLFQFPPRAMDALLEPAPGQDAKAALGHVDPGCVRWVVAKVHHAITPQPTS